MARFYDITVGQEAELRRILSNAGFTAEMAREVIGQPALAQVMVDALRRSLTLPRSERLGMFIQPMAAYERFLQRTRQMGWEFGQASLDALYREVRDAPSVRGSLCNVVTFDIWLGSAEATYTEMIRWIEATHGPVATSSKVEAADIKLFGTASIRHSVPRVELVSVDLTANRGLMAMHPVGNVRLGAFETMAVFAVHPAYPPSIEFNHVPGVLLGGLSCLRGNGPGLVPSLEWYEGGVYLRLFQRDNYSSMSYAVPVATRFQQPRSQD